MSQQNKGYWLFDRNDIFIHRGEAILVPKTGKILPQLVKDILRFSRVSGPWAIYKWIEQK